MKTNQCLDVVVGLQAGSEGKGKVVQYLSPRYRAAVRVGGHQAGHTIYHDGAKYAMRVIPCSWINPECQLIIGAGTFLSVAVLQSEIDMIERSGAKISNRLFIDPRATIVEDRHAASARHGQAWERYGSTMQGVGTARIEKLRRDGAIQRAGDVGFLAPFLADTTGLLNRFIDEGEPVLIEGHQGSLLSITTSPYYPKVTNTDPNVCGILSDAGVSPLAVREVIGVLRTYPIRVAGNSGQLSGTEIDWETVTRRSGAPDPLCETTTVTSRVRRVFEFGEEDLRQSLQINRPTKIAVTFLDYVRWEDYGKRRVQDLTEESRTWLRDVGARLDFLDRLTLVSTGKEPEMMIEMAGGSAV